MSQFLIFLLEDGVTKLPLDQERQHQLCPDKDMNKATSTSRYHSTFRCIHISSIKKLPSRNRIYLVYSISVDGSVTSSGSLLHRLV